jgi:hypothetical protein
MMSLALPLFNDLTKAAQDVLFGNVQGEGVFTSGAQVKSQTVTAGEVTGHHKPGKHGLQKGGTQMLCRSCCCETGLSMHCPHFVQLLLYRLVQYACMKFSLV